MFSFVILAKLSEQVAYNRGFLSGRKLDFALFLEVVNRHLNNSDGAINDSLLGSNERDSLLPLEHGFSDFTGVREMADFSLEDLDSSNVESLLKFLDENFAQLGFTSTESQ